MTPYNAFPTPAVVVELDIVEKNVRNMIEGLARYGIAHRPHVKTHKSVELAKLQLSLGAKGITCAKLGEAEIMAQNGIDDILVAFPMIGEDKLERYGALAEKCTLRSIVNSLSGAQGLSLLGERMGKKLEALIELDGGVHRGGVPPEDTLDFARSIAPLDGIRIVGLLYYPGLIYNENTEEGLERLAKLERDHLTEAAKLLKNHGFEMRILSGGNTPSAKRPGCLEGITEARPGNYIFNDCAQLYPGQVRPEDCALRVISTVVCRPDDRSAIIDAGTKTLTSDSFPSCAGQYGHILGHEGVNLHKLNEEHGFLKSDLPMPFAIGDKIAIVPNHACVVTNLADEVFGLRGGRFDHRIQIDARGKNS
jgi:D-serine deaminase-like pyridoxal phosphate-dependent protein